VELPDAARLQDDVEDKQAKWFQSCGYCQGEELDSPRCWHGWRASQFSSFQEGRRLEIGDGSLLLKLSVANEHENSLRQTPA